MMRALSVIQPWGHLIVKGTKNVENRTRPTRVRGFVAIHASNEMSCEDFEFVHKKYSIKINSESVSFGCIIGFVKIIDVVAPYKNTAKTKKWHQRHLSGYVLTKPIFLKKPVPAKGALGFWKLKGKPLKDSLSQLTAKQRKEILKENSRLI